MVLGVLFVTGDNGQAGDGFSGCRIPDLGVAKQFTRNVALIFMQISWQVGHSHPFAFPARPKRAVRFGPRSLPTQRLETAIAHQLECSGDDPPKPTFSVFEA